MCIFYNNASLFFDNVNNVKHYQAPDLQLPGLRIPVQLGEVLAEGGWHQDQEGEED